MPRVKNVWSYTSTLQYALMACCPVKKRTGTNLPLPSLDYLTMLFVLYGLRNVRWQNDYEIINLKDCGTKLSGAAVSETRNSVI
jgi:hypothetical protein